MKGTKIILIGLLTLVISVAAIILGGVFSQNEEDSRVAYKEVAQDDETGVTCYIEIRELSEMVTQMRRYYAKGFYYASDGTNTYLVYLKKKDAEKYLNMNLKKNPVKVKGTTGRFTSAGKRVLMCDKDTRNSLPDTYFNGTSKFGKKSGICFATAAISFVIAGFMLLIGIMATVFKKRDNIHTISKDGVID